MVKREIVGGLLIIAGVLLGIYLGGWLCFIGGIVQIAESLKVTPINSLGVAFGLLRFAISSIVGWGAFIFCGAIASALQ